MPKITEVFIGGRMMRVKSFSLEIARYSTVQQLFYISIEFLAPVTDIQSTTLSF